ncbi:prolipoprotein diacylglyceryl transferase [Acuticoccus sediminis]|uniref:Phosphatidylglycerol--prolipoprotein diacylglyceryl transferase n=1 Tax=Acuticoccus sediminis TaxID=2184697 RepID=A0A8B2NRP0_9HYPH|nr:prolipoprotein diacylglyceryl transferase [Acuticoccus sediminis]RAH98896.1 prolipoprotein diacylglyceryl transferase [Acuticoccus sediminis]
MLPVIPFPAIDPNAIVIPIPFADLSIPIRWYALAYIAGILLGWAYARRLVRASGLWGTRPRPTVTDIDDLVTWVTLGIVVGGRLGYILVYDLGVYLADPIKMVRINDGGMAFHGGLIGVIIAVVAYCHVKRISFVAVLDVMAAVVPIGLFFGRLANFVNGELWGRPSDVPWAIVFPDPRAGDIPRHPSQLYQAAMEGVLLFVIVGIAVRMGALRRPGLALGLFGGGYGVMRIIGETFRMPDQQLGFFFGDLTMGMMLSGPMIVIGAIVVWCALARPAYPDAPQPDADARAKPETP